MDVWIAGAILTLPALAPTLASVVLTIRWFRLECRHDWRPDTSVWHRHWVILGITGLSLMLCLVMLLASMAVGFGASDTAGGHACSAGVSANCSYLDWLGVVQFILGALSLINCGLLCMTPGVRRN